MHLRIGEPWSLSFCVSDCSPPWRLTSGLLPVMSDSGSPCRNVCVCFCSLPVPRVHANRGASFFLFLRDGSNGHEPIQKHLRAFSVYRLPCWVLGSAEVSRLLPLPSQSSGSLNKPTKERLFFILKRSKLNRDWIEDEIWGIIINFICGNNGFGLCFLKILIDHRCIYGWGDIMSARKLWGNKMGQICYWIWLMGTWALSYYFIFV